MGSKKNSVKLEMLKTRLQNYYTAEEKVLLNQEYKLGSRSLRRADLKEIRKAIQELESKISAIEERGTSKRKVARIIPRDF